MLSREQNSKFEALHIHSGPHSVSLKINVFGTKFYEQSLANRTVTAVTSNMSDHKKKLEDTNWSELICPYVCQVDQDKLDSKPSV